jgi:transcription termination factor Rho
VFPAIDINESSTRRDELLLGEKVTQRVYLMRRMLNQLLNAPVHSGSAGSHDPTTIMEQFLHRFSKSKSNEEFLSSLGRESM